MKKLISATLLSASMLLAVNSDYKGEVSLLLGGVYTEGNLNLERNYANAGLSIAANLDDSMFDQIEFGFLNSLKNVKYDDNTGKTSVLRVFVNAIKYYPINENSSFYALVGAGVENFNRGIRNEDGLFGNYGIGYKYNLSKQTSLKFDLRHAIETDHGDNNLLYTAGLAFAFGEKAKKVAPMMKKVVPVKKEMIKVLLDDDKDTVYNKYDKCLNTPANATVNIDGCIKSLNLNVNFKSDTDIMDKDYSKLLNDFANYLIDSNKKVIISAHTDSIGNEDYNLSLSQKRASAIYTKLLDLGVNKDNLSTMGYGEKNPITTNKTKEGRAENRRVEAIFTK